MDGNLERKVVVNSMEENWIFLSLSLIGTWWVAQDIKTIISKFEIKTRFLINHQNNIKIMSVKIIGLVKIIDF